MANLPAATDLVGLTDLYLQRADAANVYDELKKQRVRGGFMTRDLHRCQVTARAAGACHEESSQRVEFRDN